MKTTKEATLLVLAGGLGSRYKGKKQIDPMGPSGECLMEYSIYDAAKAGFTHLVLIINDYFNDETKEYFHRIAKEAGMQLDFAKQTLQSKLPAHHQDKLKDREKPWGTGHAVYCSEDVVKSPFVLINADDFYGRHAFETAYKMIERGDITDTQYGMVSYPLSATLSENGYVSRGVCTVEDGKLKTVVEHTKIEKEGGKIIFTDETDGSKKELQPDTLVSMNFWVLHPSVYKVMDQKFDRFLSNLKTIKDEFYIPFVVDEMVQEDNQSVIVETSEDKWFGVTYPEDKEVATKALRTLVDKGVYPVSLW